MVQYLRLWRSMQRYKIGKSGRAVVVHTFNSSTWEAEAVGLSEFKASLVYKASSRTVSSVTQKNPVSKKTNQQTNKQKDIDPEH